MHVVFAIAGALAIYAASCTSIDTMVTLNSTQYIDLVPEGIRFMRISPRRYGIKSPDYYMMKTEVSNAMYLRYLKDTKRNKGDSQAYQTYLKEIRQENEAGVGGGSTVDRMIIIDDPRYLWRHSKYPLGCGTYPVGLVSKAEADEFCKWLTERHHDMGTFRLPTKAEWMITAYGKDRLYPWGDKFDINIPFVSRSWKKSDLRSHPTQVDRLTRDVTPEGVMNLWGNVGEIINNRDYNGVEWMGGGYNSYPWTDGTPFTPKQEHWGGYDNPTSVLQSVGFRVLLQPQNRSGQRNQE